MVGRCSLSLCGLRGGKGRKRKWQDIEFVVMVTDLSASRVTVAVPGRAKGKGWGIAFAAYVSADTWDGRCAGYVLGACVERRGRRISSQQPVGEDSGGGNTPARAIARPPLLRTACLLHLFRRRNRGSRKAIESLGQGRGEGTRLQDANGNTSRCPLDEHGTDLSFISIVFSRVSFLSLY